MKTRTTRRTAALAAKAAPPKTAPSNDETDDEEDETPSKTFTFNGQSFATYQQMVNAKRQRNLDMLESSGLLSAKKAIDSTSAATAANAAAARARGLKRSQAATSSSVRDLPRRKSSRIAGVEASGIYVDSERSGEFTIAGGTNNDFAEKNKEEQITNYKNRVNDGSELSIVEAVELSGSKWVKDGTVESAQAFMSKTLPDVIREYSECHSDNTRQMSPTSVAKGHDCESNNANTISKSLQNNLDLLSLDDPETCVAKVVPERIYSVACHPSPHHIIACAGDKTGHVGIWNVDQYQGRNSTTTTANASSSTNNNNEGSTAKTCNDGVHLFKPHSSPVSQLLWNASGTSLLSASYDGSVRKFDASRQTFEEIFATYDESTIYKDKLGYGLDSGYKSWVQCMELDHRFGSDGKCFFLSTSEGNVMHVDLRSKGKLTFDEILSEKKINTVSLHPNGNNIATAGLSTVVQLWDLRNMGTSSKKSPQPLAWQFAGRSINSAYFSPSGKRMITTTMSHTLDILEDFHLSTGLVKSPKKSIKHDNLTGRWLSTFMARWHPGISAGEEIFVVGSMQQPRTVEIFSGSSGKLLSEIRGDALTAVASRCCFHPSADKLIVVGGNSSGRMIVAR